jgi:hypothetical protein
MLSLDCKARRYVGMNREAMVVKAVHVLPVRELALRYFM